MARSITQAMEMLIRRRFELRHHRAWIILCGFFAGVDGMAYFIAPLTALWIHFASLSAVEASSAV